MRFHNCAVFTTVQLNVYVCWISGLVLTPPNWARQYPDFTIWRACGNCVLHQVAYVLSQSGLRTKSTFAYLEMRSRAQNLTPIVFVVSFTFNPNFSDIVDIKPANMEELTEVITAAEFHPHQCNTLVYSSSKGTIRLCDMRTSALCDRHSKCESVCNHCSTSKTRALQPKWFKEPYWTKRQKNVSAWNHTKKKQSYNPYRKETQVISVY